MAKVLRTGRCGQLWVGLNSAQLLRDAGRKVRLETVLDHDSVRGGDEIEMERMNLRHERHAP